MSGKPRRAKSGVELATLELYLLYRYIGKHWNELGGAGKVLIALPCIALFVLSSLVLWPLYLLVIVILGVIAKSSSTPLDRMEDSLNETKT